MATAELRATTMSEEQKHRLEEQVSLRTRAPA
jgi:hypothetical protein